jgi:hypothetical protein
MDSPRKFGSDKNGNPNYGWEAVGLFSWKKSIIALTRSWPLNWRGYFEQGIKWDAPLGLDFGLSLWRLHTMAVQVERPWEFMAKGLDFGLGLWRLHTMPSQRLRLLYFIGYFQLISLDSRQSLASQSHGLSTWMAIVWSIPKIHEEVFMDPPPVLGERESSHIDIVPLTHPM